MLRKHSGEPTADDLERAVAQMAQIIEIHGERYLPLFLRLEIELESARTREAAMLRVKAYAKRPL